METDNESNISPLPVRIYVNNELFYSGFVKQILFHADPEVTELLRPLLVLESLQFLESESKHNNTNSDIRRGVGANTIAQIARSRGGVGTAPAIGKALIP
jgi:hypothetical protein